MPPKSAKRKRQEAAKVEEDLNSLSPDQIRTQLIATGEEIGPVNAANK